MNGSSQDKNKAAVAASLGAIVIIGVCVAYFGEFDRFYEMTFLSNMLAGGVLIAGAIKLAATGRDLPHFLYLDVAALLSTVVCVCGVFAPGVCFTGQGIILHLVNPVTVTAFYLTYCDARGARPAAAFTALVFPLAYYVFMIVYGRTTGGYIYPYFDPNRFGAPALLLFGALASGIVIFVAFTLSGINRRIVRFAEKRRIVAKDKAATPNI